LSDNRPSARKRGYTRQWERARRLFLRENPLCVNAGKPGCKIAATQVDHIVPHRGDKRLFWDRRNWQPLCASCHSRKTNAERMSSQAFTSDGQPLDPKHHWHKSG
jgi:5-methylcytosine-specific restriction endonuclease McrA